VGTRSDHVRDAIWIVQLRAFGAYARVSDPPLYQGDRRDKCSVPKLRTSDVQLSEPSSPSFPIPASLKNTGSRSRAQYKEMGEASRPRSRRVQRLGLEVTSSLSRTSSVPERSRPDQQACVVALSATRRNTCSSSADALRDAEERGGVRLRSGPRGLAVGGQMANVLASRLRRSASPRCCGAATIPSSAEAK